MLTFSDAQIEAWVAGFLWPLLRVAALVMTAPVVSHPSVPARVKIAFSAVVAIAIMPSVQVPPDSLSFPRAYVLVMQQVLIGGALGFAMRLVFAAVELAGDLIGLQMGLSFATFVDPQNANQTPLVGSFLGLMAMLIFLSLNGHAHLIAAVTDSFTTWPVGGAGIPFGSKVVATWGAELFRLGLHISLPVLTAMLVCNLALGVLVRAAPQLNLLSVGFPATLWLGLTVMGTFLPYLAPALESAMALGLGLPLRK